MTDRRTLPNADQLARRFSAMLIEDLGKGIVQVITERNEQPAYDGTCSCASHDFCDANMVMLAAVESFGFTDDDVFENDCDNPLANLWGEAWNLAKTNKFYL